VFHFNREKSDCLESDWLTGVTQVRFVKHSWAKNAVKKIVLLSASYSASSTSYGYMISLLSESVRFGFLVRDAALQLVVLDSVQLALRWFIASENPS